MYWVEPWVHADTVRRIYKEQQIRLEGRRPRVFSPRSLKVVRLVLWEFRMRWYAELARIIGYAGPDDQESSRYKILLQQRLGEKETQRLLTPFSWRDMMETWNTSGLEEHYEDERRFYQDFYRIARVVAGSFRFKTEA